MGSDLQLVRVDAVEREVLIVDRVPGLAEDASLNLVLLIRQELQLDVGVTGAAVLCGQLSTLGHTHYQRLLVLLVPVTEGLNSFLNNRMFFNRLRQPLEFVHCISSFPASFKQEGC